MSFTPLSSEDKVERRGKKIVIIEVFVKYLSRF